MQLSASDSRVPSSRIRTAGDRPVAADGDYVLYWMIAFRRTRWNFALERAADWARALDKPLIVFEALRCDYRWASRRLHSFVLDGMRDNAAALADGPVGYYPYVEPEVGAGKGLLEKLAERAALVLTDDFPSFFLPRMTAAADRRLAVRLEHVDSNGLMPLTVPDRTFPTAYAYRRFLQKELPRHLDDTPRQDAVGRATLRPASLPRAITREWPPVPPKTLDDAAKVARLLEGLPVDAEVGRTDVAGGAEAARKVIRRFVRDRLPRYAEDRNKPEVDVVSGLSPYLHFGHISSHEVFKAVATAEEWTPANLAETASGSRQGWWGMSESAEGFLDQLVTWRELGYNTASRVEDPESFDSLPDWAQRTLNEHASDPRPHLYSPEELERARTHDDLWNAAQRQLVRDGTIHNYLRMLWGKKILEWSATPQQAFEVMLDLNNRYALDGRNPNSTSGIAWVLGRYDRPWGPERPIYGKVRYMTSANTARKVRVKDYVKRYGPQAGLLD